MIRLAYLGFLFLTIIGVLLIGGCVGDDDPVTPDPNRNSTIVISPVPESLEAPWTLTGPDDFSRSGTGAQTLNVYPGDYTIVWGKVQGLATPPQESVTLSPEESTILHGIYRTLWVQFTATGPGISPNYNVTVRNTIPNVEIRVYVDFVLVGTVIAESSLDIVVEEGHRDLEFVMDEMNSFRQAIDVNHDMEWLILVIDPFGGP